MKRTGRILSLTSDINSITPVKSIFALGRRLTTIFEDDREGYAWKVIRFEPMTVFPYDTVNQALYSTRPDNFTNAANFGVWAANSAPNSNQLIGTIVYDTKNGIYYKSLKDNHMAVNTLSLFYEDGLGVPFYNITLEEYEISDKEEVMFMIKEIGQSLNQIGE